MKIYNLNFENPLQSSIFAERYLNDTKGNFSDYSGVDSRYDPQGNSSIIQLPFTCMSKNDLQIITSSPSKETLSAVFCKGGVRFFHHPDTDMNELKVDGYWKAQPTSSTRTLLLEENPRIYIKTHLDKKHFRFIRRLTATSVKHGLAVSSDLKKMIDIGDSNSNYSIFQETVGMYIRKGIYKDIGVVFRESRAYPFVDDSRVVIPFHSLYSQDPFKSEDKPLLIQLIEVNGNKEHLEYFISNIVGLILDTWVNLVSTRGLLPELHGQNSLIEIDKSLQITRIVHRDFQSMYSDNSIRKSLNLPLFEKHIVGVEKGTTVSSQYSCVFDRFLGTYLISRMVKVFCEYFNYKENDVNNEIKNYHHSIIGWNKVPFPVTTYKFSSSSLDQKGNDVELVTEGELPKFR